MGRSLEYKRVVKVHTVRYRKRTSKQNSKINYGIGYAFSYIILGYEVCNIIGICNF
jgi:hypothetical protein